MRYFFDTEFIEDGKTIDLISIGIVSENGREYYAVNKDCRLHRASDWVKENVLIHLPPRSPSPPAHSEGDMLASQAWKSHRQIAIEVKWFCLQETPPEFWADYASYDWVAMCQLFGPMMDLPEGFPMYCHDLRQEVDRLKISLPPQFGIKHHALADARWVKESWEFCMNDQRGRSHPMEWLKRITFRH